VGKNGYLYLACLWTLFVAYLCLTDFNKLPTIKISGIDKGVHFVLHFFFTVFWYLHLRTVETIKYNRIFVVILASVVYGSLIEVGQALFTRTRKGDVLDVLSNSVGTAMACLVIFLVIRFSKKE
jgi:VanZ family protein